MSIINESRNRLENLIKQSYTDWGIVDRKLQRLLYGDYISIIKELITVNPGGIVHILNQDLSLVRFIDFDNITLSVDKLSPIDKAIYIDILKRTDIKITLRKLITVLFTIEQGIYTANDITKIAVVEGEGYILQRLIKRYTISNFDELYRLSVEHNKRSITLSLEGIILNQV